MHKYLTLQFVTICIAWALCLVAKADIKREPVIASKRDATLARIPATDPYLISSLTESTIAIFDGDELVIHSWPDLTQIHRIKIPFSWCEFSKASSDGQTLFLLGVDDETKTYHLCRYSIPDRRMVWTREISNRSSSLAVSPSNKVIAVGAIEEVSLPGQEIELLGLVELIDADTGGTTQKLWGTEQATTVALSFSHSGQMLAAGFHYNASVMVFDLATGNKRTLYRGTDCGGDGEITHLLFSPDDKYLIAAGRCRRGLDGELQDTGGILLAWETEHFSLAAAHTAASTRFEALVLDPEEEMLATVQVDSIFESESTDDDIKLKSSENYNTNIKFWYFPDFIICNEFLLTGEFPRGFRNDLLLKIKDFPRSVSGIGWFPKPLASDQAQDPTEEREWGPSVVTIRVPPPCD